MTSTAPSVETTAAFHAWRNRRPLRATEVAIVLGVSRSTVHRHLCGRTHVAELRGKLYSAEVLVEAFPALREVSSWG